MFGIRAQRNAAISRPDAPLPARLPWGWVAALSWVIVGLVIGFIYGYFGRGAWALTIKTEWDIPDVLIALFTLVVALYVQHHVVENAAKRKDQIAYLVTLLANLRSAADGVMQISREPLSAEDSVIEERQRLFARSLKTTNQAAVDVRHAFEISKCRCSGAGVDEAWRVLRTTLTDYSGNPLLLGEQLAADRAYGDLRKSVSRTILELQVT